MWSEHNNIKSKYKMKEKLSKLIRVRNVCKNKTYGYYAIQTTTVFFFKYWISRIF